MSDVREIHKKRKSIPPEYLTNKAGSNS